MIRYSDTHLVRMGLVVDGGEGIFPDRFVLLSRLVALCVDLLQLLQVFVVILLVLIDQTGNKTSAVEWI